VRAENNKIKIANSSTENIATLQYAWKTLTKIKITFTQKLRKCKIRKTLATYQLTIFFLPAISTCED
jgi:hypothetical protein